MNLFQSFYKSWIFFLSVTMTQWDNVIGFRYKISSRGSRFAGLISGMTTCRSDPKRYLDHYDDLYVEGAISNAGIFAET